MLYPPVQREDTKESRCGTVKVVAKRLHLEIAATKVVDVSDPRRIVTAVNGSCELRCLDHSEHIYVLCFGIGVQLSDRDYVPGEEIDGAISHYVGWTSQQPPQLRIKAHGCQSSRHVVAIFPGDRTDEKALKRNGSCPKCGTSLWYYNAPHPGQVSNEVLAERENSDETSRQAAIAESLDRFRATVGRAATVQEIELISKPAGAMGDPSGIVGFPTLAFWQLPAGALAEDVLGYASSAVPRHVARRKDLPESMVRRIVGHSSVDALLASRRDLPGDLVRHYATHPSSEVRTAVAARKYLPDDIRDLLAGDEDAGVRERVLAKSRKSAGPLTAVEQSNRSEAS